MRSGCGWGDKGTAAQEIDQQRPKKTGLVPERVQPCGAPGSFQFRSLLQLPIQQVPVVNGQRSMNGQGRLVNLNLPTG